jgi:Eukaryotic-type carbonic anhydrase
MTIPGVKVAFEALQFHMHTGSDHALDGNYFGADLHVVHQEIGGTRLAVLGLFLEPTSPESNDKFSGLLDGWEAVSDATLAKCSNATGSATTQSFGGRRKLEKENRERQLIGTFNPYALVPDDSTFYFYSGSLTTPPCSEIVTWNVVDTAVRVSVREYMRLTNLVLDYVEPVNCTFHASIAAPSGYTSRPVQLINGRSITHKCPTGTEYRFESAAATVSVSGTDTTKSSVTTTSSAASFSLAAVVTLSTVTAALFM